MLKINPQNRRTFVKSLNSDDFKVGIEAQGRSGRFSKYILDCTSIKIFAVGP
jgi:hypothetical protein